MNSVNIVDSEKEFAVMEKTTKETKDEASKVFYKGHYTWQINVEKSSFKRRTQLQEKKGGEHFKGKRNDQIKKIIHNVKRTKTSEDIACEGKVKCE